MNSRGVGHIRQRNRDCDRRRRFGAVSEPRAEAPAALMEPGRTEQFVQVSVAAIHPKFPTWATPVTVHFRRGAEGQPWTLVGLVRLPDNRRAADRVTTSADTFA